MPDMSDYIRNKRVATQGNANRAADDRKFRAPTNDVSQYDPFFVGKRCSVGDTNQYCNTTVKHNLFAVEQLKRDYPGAGCRSAPPSVYTGILNYTLYHSSSSGLPTITNSSSWGTADTSDLVTQLLTTTSGSSGGCLIGDGSTVVPRHVDETQFNYIVVNMTGYFKPPTTGYYKFTISSDDAVAIILNGSTMVNSMANSTPPNNGPWGTYGATTSATSMSLTGGQKYPIQILWTNGVGAAYLCISDTLSSTTFGGSYSSVGYDFVDLCSPTL